MSKFFDDAWLEKNHLEWSEHPSRTVGDLLRLRGPRQLVTIGPDATAAQATQLMQAKEISQLPVLQEGKNVGSIQEVTLARVLHDNKDLRRVTVGEVMARPLPQLDVNTDLDEIYRLLLSGNTGVLAIEDGKVVGIVTRIDLIQYWTQSREK
jgi:cystathionine beta-synthase